jgi:hypothetical protein
MSVRALMGILLAAVFLVTFRVVLPTWIKDYLNGHLDQIGPYHGEIEDVDLSLYRGAYRIINLTIEKRREDGPAETMLRAPEVDLAVSWRNLWEGAIVGEVHFLEPELIYARTKDVAHSPDDREVDWRAYLETLFPLRINEMSVRDGSLTIVLPSAKPPVELHATAVAIRVTNLTNVRDVEGKRDAALEGTAEVLGDAPLEVVARFDPWGTFDNFSLDLRLTQVDLTRLNALAQAYLGIDIASGQGDFVMELDAHEGRLRGYAKPLLNNLDIYEWKQDVQDDDPPMQVLWEGLTDAISQLFTNQPKARFATRIPIEGDLENPGVGALESILGILRNAFVEAYDAYFEDVELSDRPAS